MHRVFVENLPPTPGKTVEIGGEEAHHARRVKRVREGEAVELLAGRGGIAGGVVAAGALERGSRGRDREGALRVRVESIRRVEPVRPRVEVFSAVPKGDRAAEMIDQLAQVGAALWRPLETARSVVDPREHKLERLQRIAREASKQCGRAWVMEIGEKATFSEAIDPPPGTHGIMADASGQPWRAHETRAALRLLIGPEGGWTEGEVEQARTSAVALSAFGPHAMRIETAAVVACGMVLALDGAAPSECALSEEPSSSRC